MPRLDERFGMAGRRALARLGGLAAVDAQAWESVLAPIERGLLGGDEGGGGGRLTVEASALLEQHVGVQARLVRRWAARLGVALDYRQTQSVLRFVRSAKSGAAFAPRAGLLVTRDFDHVAFSRPDDACGSDEISGELQISDVADGSGRVALGSRRFAVRWSTQLLEPSSTGWVEHFSSELRYPARVRAWRPGDRVLFDFGSKKLKKLFGEARVPVRVRETVPVLVDSEDRVLWVPGLARSRLALPAEGEVAMAIRFEEEDS